MAKLKVRLTDAPKPLPDFTKLLKFGTVRALSRLSLVLRDAFVSFDLKHVGVVSQMYTDHIAIRSFDPVTGWSAPEIKPYGPLTLDPASSCLQYANGMFEGMKVSCVLRGIHLLERLLQAYLGHDGKVRLFRPAMNMRRLERSAARLALPVRPHLPLFTLILTMDIHIARRRRCGARAHQAPRPD